MCEANDVVISVFVGNRQARLRVTPEPGTLTMFRGDRSLHRVAPPVGGTRDWLMAIFI